MRQRTLNRRRAALAGARARKPAPVGDGARKARIAVFFPSFLGGGAEGVCLWILEALRAEYELTLHTFSEVDFARLNEYYGTHLGKEEVEVVQPLASATLNRVVAGSRRLFTLRQHLLIRHLKRLGQEHELRISAFNEMDLGEPGIQYVHFPLYGRGHERVRGEILAPDSSVRAAYRDFCRLLSGFSDSGMRQNLTLVNSRWTAGIVRRVYGIEARVVYPPVLAVIYRECPGSGRRNRIHRRSE